MFGSNCGFHTGNNMPGKGKDNNCCCLILLLLLCGCGNNIGFGDDNCCWLIILILLLNNCCGCNFGC